MTRCLLGEALDAVQAGAEIIRTQLGGRSTPGPLDKPGLLLGVNALIRLEGNSHPEAASTAKLSM